MNRRTLALLTLAVAVLAGLASLGTLRGPARGSGDGPFLPELKPVLADLTGVTITGPGKQVIATIVRDGERWVVRESGNYPADVAKLRQNLTALADGRKLEEKTSSPELYARLGVADPAENGSRAVQLDFSGPKSVPSVLIGDTGVGGGDRAYLRRVAEATSWLVSGRYDIGKTTGDWLERDLVDLPAEKIRRVSITHPGIETLRLDRTEAKPEASNPDFTVRDLPPGRRLAYDGIANGVAGALAGLTLDGVATRETLGASPPKPIVARFETVDGLVVEVSGWRLPLGTRFTLQASAPADKADLKTNLKAEADALNARVGGWVFTLPAFKAELLTRRLADLLQPP